MRNLTAGARYPAGTHTIYWDGYDVGKAVKYKPGNVGTRYDIKRRRVAPGVYRVRGLVHRGQLEHAPVPAAAPCGGAAA